MMTKENFIKRIALVQNFRSEQETLQVLIDKLSDGYSVVTYGGYLIDCVLDMISEDFGVDKDDDLLSWWMYDDSLKKIWTTDKDSVDNKEETEWDVSTVEGLYDYMVKWYGDGK